MNSFFVEENVSILGFNFLNSNMLLFRVMWIFVVLVGSEFCLGILSLLRLFVLLWGKLYVPTYFGGILWILHCKFSAGEGARHVNSVSPRPRALAGAGGTTQETTLPTVYFSKKENSISGHKPREMRWRVGSEGLSPFLSSQSRSALPTPI